MHARLLHPAGDRQYYSASGCHNHRRQYCRFIEHLRDAQRRAVMCVSPPSSAAACVIVGPDDPNVNSASSAGVSTRSSNVRGSTSCIYQARLHRIRPASLTSGACIQPREIQIGRAPEIPLNSPSHHRNMSMHRSLHLIYFCSHHLICRRR